MIILLSYPRSGQNLTLYLLRSCGQEVRAYHGIEPVNFKSWYKWPLVVVIRNYKECIVRNHSGDRPFTNEVLDRTFHEVRMNSTQLYIENLEVYENWPNTKHLLYYEDLVSGPDAFMEMAEKFKIDTSKFNWYESFKQSLDSYADPRMSGGLIHFHEQYIVDPDYMNWRIRAINPVIYDKYLTRYKDNYDFSLWVSGLGRI